MNPEILATHNQTNILIKILEGAKSWKEIKKLAKLADATLAKHIKALLEEGLITEEIDRKDRRRKIYSITEKGKERLTHYEIAKFVLDEYSKQSADFRGRNILYWTQITISDSYHPQNPEASLFIVVGSPTRGLIIVSGEKNTYDVWVLPLLKGERRAFYIVERVGDIFHLLK